jgi:hypothetical protein
MYFVFMGNLLLPNLLILKQDYIKIEPDILNFFEGSITRFENSYLQLSSNTLGQTVKVSMGLLNVSMLSSAQHYAKCHFAKHNVTKCHFAQFLYSC